ncbi:6-carboxytetrahydropterin synthase [Pseudoalteromonas sp. T1lg48]|uniref:6-carboxytetrahydropterin synthase n=1 Tax=Pseudoalteromonas sp. T1lg48 TaxID=2077100 RepID=UPI000CF67FA5|nr:6-carboxytetrahydropterin synthase [Pseudoalteromonas sp. T1lg48]
MTLFVNDLTVIDFSYFCPDRGPVGESWIVDLTLDGDLNDESMVLDFGLVKKQIKRIIDDSVDHTLAVPMQADLSLVERDELVILDARFGANHHLAMSAPLQAVSKIDAPRIDEQALTAHLITLITPQLPANVTGMGLHLRPEPSSSFYYHYSHGLKKHDGNCQRIIHGHRSTLGIELDGMAMPRLQKEWADRWQDIYLLSAEDKVDATQLQHIQAQEGDLCSRYRSTQGEFELAISAECVEILPCDTTVECIADFMAQELKQQHPDKQVKVTAYEGVGKGSISYA